MNQVNNKELDSNNLKIAYIHATSFPSTEANTFDSIWSASAINEQVDTTFFMPRIKAPISELKNYYEISDSNLRFQSMHLDLIPDRLLLKYKNTYENLLSLLFKFKPEWSKFNGLKILYVREPKQLLFWGLNRKRKNMTENWIFAYEAHDTLGLDPHLFYNASMSDDYHYSDEMEKVTLEAAQNFDLMICNTKILADDMQKWSKNTLKPKVLTLASPLPRRTHPQEIAFKDKIIIGYNGTVDKLRGVDILLESVKHLPDNYLLRIVGRFRQEKNEDPNWLSKLVEQPDLKNKIDLNLVNQINDVAAEIDKCDILVQPASNDLHDSRYAAPLKSYSYMVRGKPIVAGDVPCHRELFNDGEDALLYELTPEDLAKKIVQLGSDAALAKKIANGALQKSEMFSFTRKVADLLTMVKEVAKEREIL